MNSQGWKYDGFMKNWEIWKIFKNYVYVSLIWSASNVMMPNLIRIYLFGYSDFQVLFVSYSEWNGNQNKKQIWMEWKSEISGSALKYPGRLWDTREGSILNGMKIWNIRFGSEILGTAQIPNVDSKCCPRSFDVRKTAWDA